MSLYRGQRRPFVAPKIEPLTINWRRGLFRVWVLASSSWVMAWAIYLIMYAIREGQRTVDLLVIPVLLIGPPLALLVFGFGVGWAFRGFRADPEPSESTSAET